MSCFGGKMREYDEISIDRFDNYKGNLNLQSTVYFLSHFHKDHTVGLSTEGFHERLRQSRRVFLYCTEVTRILLLGDSQYKHLQKYVRTLEIEVPTVVVIPNEYTGKDDQVTVTLIPAGHCPGSVMFLFEGREGTVLYTGDFRWEEDEVFRCSWFKSGDSVKDVKSLYVDTTFCIPEAFYIPSRRESVTALCNLVRGWVTEHTHNYVHISSKTSYGHEHLMKGVAEEFGLKIHVSAEKFQLYEQIPELRGVFTTDPSETPLHACSWMTERDKESKLPCGYLPAERSEVKVMVVRPSTMWFTQGVSTHDICVKTGYLHRLCYSFHSSFSEVRDLVMHLRPRRVFPNVKPMNNTMEEVQARLNQFLKLTPKQHLQTHQVTPTKPLGILRKRSINHIQGSLSDSEELCFSEPRSPRQRKRRMSSGSIPSTPAKKVSLYFSDFAADRTPESSQDISTTSVSHASDGGSHSMETHSSYTPSHHSGSEMDLCDGDIMGEQECCQVEATEEHSPPGGSYLAYLSGDDDDDSFREYVIQNKISSSLDVDNVSRDTVIDHHSSDSSEIKTHHHSVTPKREDVSDRARVISASHEHPMTKFTARRNILNVKTTSDDSSVMSSAEELSKERTVRCEIHKEIHDIREGKLDIHGMKPCLGWEDIDERGGGLVGIKGKEKSGGLGDHEEGEDIAALDDLKGKEENCGLGVQEGKGDSGALGGHDEPGEESGRLENLLRRDSRVFHRLEERENVGRMKDVRGILDNWAEEEIAVREYSVRVKDGERENSRREDNRGSEGSERKKKSGGLGDLDQRKESGERGDSLVFERSREGEDLGVTKDVVIEGTGTVEYLGGRKDSWGVEDITVRENMEKEGNGLLEGLKGKEEIEQLKNFTGSGNNGAKESTEGGEDIGAMEDVGKILDRKDSEDPSRKEDGEEHLEVRDDIKGLQDGHVGEIVGRVRIERVPGIQVRETTQGREDSVGWECGEGEDSGDNKGFRHHGQMKDRVGEPMEREGTKGIGCEETGYVGASEYSGRTEDLGEKRNFEGMENLELNHLGDIEGRGVIVRTRDLQGTKHIGGMEDVCKMNIREESSLVDDMDEEEDLVGSEDSERLRNNERGEESRAVGVVQGKVDFIDVDVVRNREKKDCPTVTAEFPVTGDQGVVKEESNFSTGSAHDELCFQSSAHSEEDTVAEMFPLTDVIDSRPDASKKNEDVPSFLCVTSAPDEDNVETNIATFQRCGQTLQETKTLRASEAMRERSQVAKETITWQNIEPTPVHDSTVRRMSNEERCSKRIEELNVSKSELKTSARVPSPQSVPVSHSQSSQLQKVRQVMESTDTCVKVAAVVPREVSVITDDQFNSLHRVNGTKPLPQKDLVRDKTSGTSDTESINESLEIGGVSQVAGCQSQKIKHSTDCRIDITVNKSEAVSEANCCVSTRDNKTSVARASSDLPREPCCVLSQGLFVPDASQVVDPAASKLELADVISGEVRMNELGGLDEDSDTTLPPDTWDSQNIVGTSDGDSDEDVKIIYSSIDTDSLSVIQTECDSQNPHRTQLKERQSTSVGGTINSSVGWLNTRWKGHLSLKKLPTKYIKAVQELPVRSRDFVKRAKKESELSCDEIVIDLTSDNSDCEDKAVGKYR